MLHNTQPATIAAASQTNLREDEDGVGGPEGVDGIAFSLLALQ